MDASQTIALVVSFLRCSASTAFLLALAGLLWAGGLQTRAVHADEFEKALLTTELLTREVLPLQAVAIRITVRYPMSITRMYVPQYAVGVIDMNAPRPVSMGQALPELWHGIEPLNSLRIFYERQAAGLRPGEKSQLIAAYFTRVVNGTKVRPIFEKAGRYQLEFALSSSARDRVSSSVKIDVVEPKGADLELYKILCNDQELLSGLLMPGCLSEKELERIDELVTAYPFSSYAPYLRVAVARQHCRHERYDRALRELRAIKSTRFALDAAAAVMLLRSAENSRGTEDDIAAKNRLDREFRDTLDWLDEHARLVSLSEWTSLRIALQQDGPPRPVDWPPIRLPYDSEHLPCEAARERK